ncbi:MAG: dynamin family protein [Lamprobacter sp.]|uniref:dynamin family protein n=1 Tax=Lamprobacter sp. TaxID=3100796 RepID=UPI002B262BE8|nr:dynamin family protein [Lamprobacter sp.]MEA3640135.1 dynamin family protein [Lamprobacter sp.]
MTERVSFEPRKQQLQAHYDRLLAVLETGDVMPDPAPDLALLRAARDALDGDLRLRVLLVGDSSTGKSSFINRFLLNQDLLPAWSTPTTTFPTRIRHGQQLRAIRYQPSAREGVDLEEEVVTDDIAETLKAWVSTAGNLVADGSSPVFVETPTLPAGLEIVDAPGLNDPNPERMKLTLDYLNQADGVLFFINAMRPWTRYEETVFEGEVLSRELFGRLSIVVNYWDQIEASQRDEVMAYIDQRVQASLAKRAAATGAAQAIPILPVSAKTGENTALIQEQVWDVLSARKSQEVLALRIRRFNQELTKYAKILDDRLMLLGLDAQGQARRRTQLQQEIKDYEQQREAFLRNLQRLLVPDFQQYQAQFQRLFEGMKDAVMDLENDALALCSAEEINALLSQRLSHLQKQTVRKLEAMDAAFLERLRATIEGQKANIGILPSTALTMEEYVLRWQGLDGAPLAESAPIAMGGMGLAGLLVGAGTAWQTATVATATPGALATIGAFFTGAPAAAASSFMLFGVPAIAIGALLLGGAYLMKAKGNDNLRKQVRAACIQLTEKIDDEQWKTLDQLKANQSQRISQICADVDDDIARALQERLTELEAIQQIEDQGAALKALRDQIAGLELRVNG